MCRMLSSGIGCSEFSIGTRTMHCTYPIQVISLSAFSDHTQNHSQTAHLRPAPCQDVWARPAACHYLLRMGWLWPWGRPQCPEPLHCTRMASCLVGNIPALPFPVPPQSDATVSSRGRPFSMCWNYINLLLVILVWLFTDTSWWHSIRYPTIFLSGGFIRWNFSTATDGGRVFFSLYINVYARFWLASPHWISHKGTNPLTALVVSMSLVISNMATV